MADVLLELGYSNGHRRPALSAVTPAGKLSDIFSLVDSVENPIVGIYGRNDAIPPQALKIAARIRAISLHNRMNLGRQTADSLARRKLEWHGRPYRPGYKSIRGIELGYVRMDGEIAGLYEIGKSLRKKLGSVAKKVGKVVKSPAFLGVVAIGAAFIPGVGPFAAAAIGSAASLAAKTAADKKTLAAEKKRQAAMMVEDPNLAAQLMAEADKLDREAASAIQQGQFAQLAAGMGAAAGLAVPGAADGAKSFLDSLPKPLQSMAGKLAPGLAEDMKNAGTENLIGTAMKGLGQFVGMNSLSEASGAGGIGKLTGNSALDSLIGKIAGSADANVKKAIQSGEDDIKASAAADGLDGDELFGKGGFPVLPVVVGIAATGVIIAIAVS